jgi:peptide-methionine (S)-S-oxide reductase
MMHSRELWRLYCTNDKKEDTFGKPIVTKISASKFYVAEDYHKNYYNDNKSGYCSYITSKIEIKKAVWR